MVNVCHVVAPQDIFRLINVYPNILYHHHVVVILLSLGRPYLEFITNPLAQPQNPSFSHKSFFFFDNIRLWYPSCACVIVLMTIFEFEGLL